MKTIHRLPFAILIIFILSSSTTIAQDFEYTLMSDSIACDTFPPPRNLDGYTQDDAARLWWEVPLLNPPENLLGYNLYRNNQLLDYIEYDGADTTFCWDLNVPWPDYFIYKVTALYDLTPCGYPGDTAESDPSNEIELWIGIDFILPFVEDWNTGSFDPNLWTAEENWSVNGDYGNPLPAALFEGSQIDETYAYRLSSYSINCRDHPETSDPYIDGDFYLEFDIKLIDLDTCGIDRMKVQFTDTSMVYQTITEFTDTTNGFPWESHKINITPHVKRKWIKIAFLAEGEGGSIININRWYIDNIKLYRHCNPPRELQWVVFDEIMAWHPPIPHTVVKDANSKELQGYDIYGSDNGYTFLDFTTDTFYMPVQSYDYYYVTAVYDDCGPASNELIGPVTIVEDTPEKGIKLYPNPADESITISASSPILKLSVIHLSGQVLIEKDIDEQQYQINTSSLPNGIYIIEAIVNDRNIRKKFVVRH